MNSDTRISSKDENIKNKNIFMRMLNWIARGAAKVEKGGGGCVS